MLTSFVWQLVLSLHFHHGHASADYGGYDSKALHDSATQFVAAERAVAVQVQLRKFLPGGV